jgi:hypothetical protein
MPKKEIDQETDPADGDGNESPVTREDFNRIMQRLDAQSKYIARLEKGLSGKSTATGDRNPQAETNGDPPGLREQVARLAEEQTVIRQERDALNRQKIVSTLSRVLQKKGVPALLAEDAAEVALNRNQGSFKLDGSGEVSFEHNGESLTVDAWSGMYLATEKGAAYIPAKNGPSRVSIPKNGNSSTGRKVTITAEQLARGEFDPAAVEGDLSVAE